MTTITDALADPNLLGAALGPTTTWQTWLVVLKAAFGQQLTDAELVEFAIVAGSRKPPAQRVRELWTVAGRRSGKSRMAAAVVVFIACFLDHRERLAPGETGYVLCLSATKAQAELIRSYALAFLEQSPVLAGEIVNVTAEEIVLRGGIVIAVHTNSFRSTRGRTILAAVFDESAFWRDESSAVPDVETYRAVIPSLVASNGLLVGISSPYRRVGLLHSKFQRHYGQDDDDVLVVKGASATFNPTINVALIEQARKDDAEAASAEWDGEFHTDLSALLADDVIDRAIDRDRPLELPRRRDRRYTAFVDASAGRHDRFGICIGSMDGDKFTADVVRGVSPPFDPREIAREYADLAKAYGCSTIIGDNYSGDWVSRTFEEFRLTYQQSELPKSGLYLEGLPKFNQGNVSIPDLPPLIRELRLLERRTSRSGRDSVDHPRNGSDDLANVVFGCAYHAAGGGNVGEFSCNAIGGFGYSAPPSVPSAGRIKVVVSESFREGMRRENELSRGRLRT